MRQSKVVLCVAVALFGMTTVGLAEGEGDVAFGVGADFMSKYVWRGQNLVDDWVLQPSVSASYQGFTASVWANSDMTGDTADDWELTELDYTIDYSGTVPGADGIGYSIGAIYYYFPGGDATTELYWGFSFDVPAMALPPSAASDRAPSPALLNSRRVIFMDAPLRRGLQ